MLKQDATFIHRLCLMCYASVQELCVTIISTFSVCFRMGGYHLVPRRFNVRWISNERIQTFLGIFNVFIMTARNIRSKQKAGAMADGSLTFNPRRLGRFDKTGLAVFSFDQIDEGKTSKKWWPITLYWHLRQNLQYCLVFAPRRTRRVSISDMKQPVQSLSLVFYFRAPT